MHFFKLGDRYINLAYLIVAERIDPDHDKVRVTLETGVSFDHDGPDATGLFERLQLLAENPFPRPASLIVSRPGDSAAGPVREAGA